CLPRCERRQSRNWRHRMAAVPPQVEILWRQYAMHVDLYKHYLDIALKFNAFYYAATGALVSFYFSRSDVSVLRYSLFFPIIMSVLFGLFFIYGAIINGITREDVFNIRDQIGLHVSPELR